MARTAAARPPVTPSVDDPQWYRDAIIYEIHVRSFFDSDGDGIGDFRGLTRKLDYLQDLGVTALWLLPFYESPLRDDGYDIADYRKIHPAYGNLRDFRHFLQEAHARGLRVITELVLNHTSDQHAWFQRARHAPKGSPERNYYVWSDTAEEYAQARIIFKDFERSNWTWDPVAGQYYWHRFYSHQPDLNYDNPRVRREVKAIADFWLAQGVDGFRLDAVPYLFEREGTSCENLPETHAFLKELRAHVDAKFPGRMLLAEANQWPEDAAAYFGAGDECHMAYHFPLMPRLFMGVRMEDRFPITEILEQTPPIPEGCQWALFLRNHDELTLEMVTDEERDYMYRVFASDERARINLGIRRRLAPLLGHNRRLIELMNALLLSLPGTPVIYYGDEIGMGDNIYLGDRNGVRTPMQWSADRNAGFSVANPQRLYLPVIIDPEYHYEAINVDAQQANPSLLLWWMRRIIALRRRHRAFGRGSFTIVENDNRRVFSFIREYEGERILVVANLSRFVQAAGLDLGGFSGHTPVEMFGQTRFPAIRDEPYFLSLGPHTFYWFTLEQPRDIVTLPGGQPGEARPALRVEGTWESVTGPRQRAALERVLAGYIPQRRWFGGKARPIRRLLVHDVVPVRRRGKTVAHWLFVRIEYTEGEPELYSLPVTVLPPDRAAAVAQQTPWAIIGPVAVAGDEHPWELVDALATPELGFALMDGFRLRSVFPGQHQQLTLTPLPGFRAPATDDGAPPPSILRGEQSNTSLAYDATHVLKAFRRVEPGPHQQFEMERFLAGTPARTFVPHVDAVAVIGDGKGPSTTVAILERFIHHQTDGWTYALDELARFLEEVAAERPPVHALRPGIRPVDLIREPVPAEMAERAGGWLDLARLLGQRTAQLHLALASRPDDPDFAPEGYTPFYQRALAEGLRARARRTFQLLRSQLPRLEPSAAELARQVLAAERAILARLQGVASRTLAGQRLRTHGDFHLGQVLFTGRDFVIIDFEGEPARSLGDRRVKRSPLRDVAGMIRSFHYAARTGLRRADESLAAHGSEAELEGWAGAWYLWTSARFLAAYFETAAGSPFVPSAGEEAAFLLDIFLLDKALYEVAYELENRPDWVVTPLEGVLAIIGTSQPERSQAT
jgi:maltose alpha-D-glucosyltransferase/alpha-amylase